MGTALRLCILVAPWFLCGCDAVSEKTREVLDASNRLIQRTYDCQQERRTQVNEACDDLQAEDSTGHKAAGD